ncbi:unnamed protein product [Cuscuta campestris]|uniref:Retrotransposon Copia-like N-terminal domain-containing protein n=1 Tax=Cuscuta campestris TaxID=132261 RepID=A0A484LSC3_9ASTE|nr:unnamed protein product [Cuscuta campestris]
MANNTNNLALRSILDKDKLNGTNFVDWQRNLCIVLRMDEKEYVLEKPIPPAPPANAPKAVKDAYEKHVKDDNQNPIPLFCDNNGAIAQAKEPRSHQKTKHIVRRYHIIREIVARGDVEICKVGTDDNIADPLTKALGKPKHESHTWSMGIREMLDWP